MRVRGIVLAAGAALRLGEPKALVDLAGRSFLSRVIDALSTGGTSEIVVVVGEPHAAAVRAAVAGKPDVEAIENPDPSRVQLSSIQAVLAYGDIAIVYYVATYSFRTKDGESGVMPLRSVDIYRKQGGAWIQCGSHIAPIPTGGAWGEGNQSQQ